MTETKTTLPNLADILGPILRRVSAEQRPLLIAAAERMAANRYRRWAELVDESLKSGMLACAEREDEVARRVETMFPNADALQMELLSQAPELTEASGSLFASLALHDQFALQAQGERAGAATWKAYAAKASDSKVQGQFLQCARLEEDSAEFLESILTRR
jgi:hypothetical protein